VDLRTQGTREERTQQADGAGAQDEHAIAPRQGGGPDRPQRVRAGLDQGAGHRVDRVGQGMQSAGRDRQLIGERSGPATADADLRPVLAEVLAAAQAAVTAPTPEHRVARRSAADPALVHALAHGRDGPPPLVSQAHGVASVALVEVCHVAREELDVRAAQPDAFDVHHDLTRQGDRRWDVLHGARSWSADDERPHRRCRPSVVGARFAALGRAGIDIRPV
jgi:hypothetical protein